MIISTNSSSSLIKGWQNFLNQQGFSVGAPDGLWGPHTKEGTEAFQKAHNLTADGVPGPATLAEAEKLGFITPTVASSFNIPGTTNSIFDISHHNADVDFKAAKAAGMQAVFQKATQYTSFIDGTYADRKKDAIAEGLLWGAYHFGAAGDGSAQADYFLDTAQPNGDTLLVLDFERDTVKGQSTMPLADAHAFINRIQEKTGKLPGLYGGSYLKSLVQSKEDTLLSQCWLWLADYRNTPSLPNGWTNYTFWQYTDGKHGPGAIPVTGVGACDRDLFAGDAESLINFWKEHQV